jgi:hypothetical protein
MRSPLRLRHVLHFALELHAMRAAVSSSLGRSIRSQNGVG